MLTAKYHKGGSKKYVLDEPFWETLHFKPHEFIYTDYGYIQTNGRITILRGFEWDGPSGPAIDTKDFMDGALIHDFLYALMRDGKLPLRFRRKADKEMRLQCKKDGMPWPRRMWTWFFVRVFGYSAAGGTL
jgi:hypothetical protein